MADCDSQECINARMAFQAAKNKILSLCSQIKQLRADLESKNKQADNARNFMLALLLLAAALAAFLPWPFSLFVTGGVLLAAAILAGVMIGFLIQANNIEADISKLQEELVAARKAFDKAVADVMKACGPDCWDDLNQPPCP